MKKNISRIRHHVNPLADRTEHAFNGFGDEKSIIVDVGAEQGEFTQGLLEKYGDTKNIIVFEIRKPLAEKLREKFITDDNIIVFDGDANRNFKNIVKPCIDRGSHIEEIFINFPDPWFKERHKKRRVINEKFLESCRMFIPHSTTWSFQTDQKGLFDETRGLLRDIGINHVAQFFDPPHGVKTKWENIKTAEGEKIYRMRFWL